MEGIVVREAHRRVAAGPRGIRAASLGGLAGEWGNRVALSKAIEAQGEWAYRSHIEPNPIRGTPGGWQAAAERSLGGGTAEIFVGPSPGP